MMIERTKGSASGAVVLSPGSRCEADHERCAQHPHLQDSATELPRIKPVAVFADDKFQFPILTSAVALNVQGKQEDVQFDELHNKNLRDQSVQTICTVTIVT
ncbi:unnamed protein product [Calypogeia fissa]